MMLPAMSLWQFSLMMIVCCYFAVTLHSLIDTIMRRLRPIIWTNDTRRFRSRPCMEDPLGKAPENQPAAHVVNHRIGFTFGHPGRLLRNFVGFQWTMFDDWTPVVMVNGQGSARQLYHCPRRRWPKAYFILEVRD